MIIVGVVQQELVVKEAKPNEKNNFNRNVSIGYFKYWYS